MYDIRKYIHKPFLGIIEYKIQLNMIYVITAFSREAHMTFGRTKWRVKAVEMTSCLIKMHGIFGANYNRYLKPFCTVH